MVVWDWNGRSTGTEQSLPGFDRTLLVQCRTSQVTRAAEAAGQAGGGLVVTAEGGNLRGCLDRARLLLEVGRYRHPVLLDAARYAGVTRLPAAAAFDERWIRGQRELGLPVLTDSGYLAPDDMAGFVGILERTAKLGDAIALLPIHPAWLANRYARQTLIRYVGAVGVPIAVILEHPADPFDGVGVLDGLLELFGCGVPVLLLRSDLSALGALCSGAAAAAVGAEPALRPGYPPRLASAGPRSRPDRPSALIRQCLSYQPMTVIEAAIRRHPDNGMWHCDCPTCGGRDLDWLIAQPESAQARLAFQHCVNVLLELRAELIGTSVQLNQWSWRARCAAATSRRLEVGWDRLPMLHRWQEAIGARTAPEPTIPAPRRPAGLARRPTAGRRDAITA